MREIEEVLGFWFSDRAEPFWFEKDAEFDAAVRRTLGPHLERARAGRCGHWPATARGALALILLFDQVPRNLCRGTTEAFVHDRRARALSRQAVACGHHRRLARQSERLFLYLPLEHSEDLADQELCVRLVAELDEEPDWLVYAERHREIVARFGRFPHRNAALGRETTPDEAEFLKQPRSSF
jgi:uncharacterized protein (DUF924 family)